MSFNKSLIPWKWGKKSMPVRKEEAVTDYPTVFSLQEDMNRLVENFFRTFDSGSVSPFGLDAMADPASPFHPRLDVSETGKELRVSIELPGLDEKDLDLFVSGNSLTIKGEKREEHKENMSGYYRMERHFGSFQRTIPLPCEVQEDQAQATFNRGVLTVVLPKHKNAQKEVRKIPISKES